MSGVRKVRDDADRITERNQSGTKGLCSSTRVLGQADVVETDSGSDSFLPVTVH